MNTENYILAVYDIGGSRTSYTGTAGSKRSSAVPAEYGTVSTTACSLQQRRFLRKSRRKAGAIS